MIASNMGLSRAKTNPLEKKRGQHVPQLQLKSNKINLNRDILLMLKMDPHYLCSNLQPNHLF